MTTDTLRGDDGRDGRTITRLRAPDFPSPHPDFTAGVRFGPWVFVSGTMAADHERGVPREVAGNPAVPLAGEHRLIRESRYVLARIDELLREAGAGLQDVVRVDQFPSTRDMIDPYHVARKEVIHPPRPASTSVHVPALLSPDCHIAVEVIAAIPSEGFRKAGINADIPQPLAGYSPAIRIGDFVFAAGQVPTDWKTGVAPEARVDPNFWEGNRIDREARFTLTNLQKTLQAAGASMASVVKAQVYLTDIADLPRLDRVWREFFPENPPARTLYPIASLAIEGRIEINLVALCDDGGTRKEVVKVPGARAPLFHESTAIRAGDLLFLSGLMAADQDGLVPGARSYAAYPHARDTAAAQMEDILAQAQRICAAAGTDLRHAVRMLTVHADIAEHASARRARRPFFPDGEPATTTIGVGGPLQVPGCTILADLWVAVP